jgi:hypothetical protein
MGGIFFILQTFPEAPNRRGNTKGKMHPDAPPPRQVMGGIFFILQTIAVFSTPQKPGFLKKPGFSVDH